MGKLRSNSDWRKLTRTQRQTAEKWLFDDHLSYEESSARIKTEFGVEISAPSLGRYYRRRAAERQIAGLDETQAIAEALAGSTSSASVMRTATLKLLAGAALKMACERPDQLKDLAALAKILLMSEDNDIRRGWLKLKQDQFHFGAASAASEELPRLASLLLKIQDDPDLSPEAKLEKVHALLFPDEARQGLHPSDAAKSEGN